MEEIVPAARLLSRATSEVPQDFEHSKQVFLHTVDNMKVVAEVRAPPFLGKPECETGLTASVLGMAHAQAVLSTASFRLVPCSCHSVLCFSFQHVL